MAHLYCKDGFGVFPKKKLTAMSCEGVLCCIGCILGRFGARRRGWSWIVFSRERVRFHGITLFNVSSRDWVFSKREILSVHTNTDKDIPFLRKGRAFPFSPLCYFFERQSALCFRWPAHSPFLVVETRDCFFLFRSGASAIGALHAVFLAELA